MILISKKKIITSLIATRLASRHFTQTDFGDQALALWHKILKTGYSWPVGRMFDSPDVDRYIDIVFMVKFVKQC